MTLRSLCWLAVFTTAAFGQVIPMQIAATVTPSSPTVNEGVQVNVTVLSPSDPVPSQANVLFSINGVGIWFNYHVPIANGTAVVRSPPLPYNSYTISVQVTGTTVSAISNNLDFPLQVRPGTLTLGVPTATQTSVRTGQSIQISSTVSPRFVSSVTFEDGNRVLGSTFVDVKTPDTFERADGIATISTSFNQTGLYQVKSRYAGSPGYAAAESGPLQIEVRGSPVLQLTSSSSTASAADIVRLSARVTGQGVTPSGQVRLVEGATVVAEAALDSNGSAQFTVPAGTLAPGRHVLFFRYAGDRFYDADASSAVSLDIAQSLSPTQTQLTQALGSAGAQLSAKVTGGATTPTGTVTFRDQKTGLSYPVVLSGGTATLQSSAVLGHWVEASYGGDSTHASSTASKLMALAPLNGFSYSLGDFASEEVVAIFGEGLGGSLQVAGATLPETLDSAQVTVIDSTGSQKRASFYFVSPTQATVVFPIGLATGPAQLQFRSSSGEVYAATIRIASVAPGIATANSDGRGAPAAQLIRVLPDGTSAVESPIQFDAAGKWVPAPVSFLNQEVYLVLYGTGFRGAPVTCSGGGLGLSVLYGGAQGTYAGLDQVNVRLPVALQGKGFVEVKCSAGGVDSNPVTLLFP